MVFLFFDYPIFYFLRRKDAEIARVFLEKT